MQAVDQKILETHRGGLLAKAMGRLSFALSRERLNFYH